MATERRKIDEKGRVTIPKHVRERLGIEAGEEVTIAVDDGEVVVRPQITRDEFVETMAGIVNESTRDSRAEPTDPLETKAVWTSDL